MKSGRAFAFMLIGALALRANAAAAQATPAAPAEAVTPPAETRWYGWQTAIADGASAGLFLMAADYAYARKQTEVTATLALGGGLFLLGGPIVHAAHGSWGKAGLSFALRGGLVLLGGLAGDGSDCNYATDHEGCPILHAIYGMVAGGVVAAIIDAALIGHEPVADRTGGRGSCVAFTPLRDGGALLLVGRF